MSIFRRNLIINGASSKDVIPEGCVFWLPLDSAERTTDLVGGESLQIASTSGFTANFDTDKNMWHFKISSSASTGYWCARIKTNWTIDDFPTNTISTVAKMEIVKPSSQKYLQSILLSNSSVLSKNTTFNQALLLAPYYNGSTDTNQWLNNAYNPDIFYHSVTNTVQYYFSKDTFGNFSTNTNRLPSYFIGNYDGYIYFGGVVEHWQQGTEYWLSDVMVFNKELTREEIFNLPPVKDEYIPFSIQFSTDTAPKHFYMAEKDMTWADFYVSQYNNITPTDYNPPMENIYDYLDSSIQVYAGVPLYYDMDCTEEVLFGDKIKDGYNYYFKKATGNENKDVYLTMNATTDENKRAYDIMNKESIFDTIYSHNWYNDYSSVNMFVSGTANGSTFTNAPVTWTTRGRDYTNMFSPLHFEGFENIAGISVMSTLSSNGTFNVWDDD